MTTQTLVRFMKWPFSMVLAVLIAAATLLAFVCDFTAILIFNKKAIAGPQLDKILGRI